MILRTTLILTDRANPRASGLPRLRTATPTPRSGSRREIPAHRAGGPEAAVHPSREIRQSLTTLVLRLLVSQVGSRVRPGESLEAALGTLFSPSKPH